MEEKKIHLKSLAEGRWFTFSFEEQMGNIGSEIGRTINAFKINDIGRQNSCFERAIELFRLTLEDNRWQREERDEVIKSRDKFIALLTDTSPEDEKVLSELDKLDNYFLEYGIAANNNRLTKYNKVQKY
jgi:hypothetical protein